MPSYDATARDDLQIVDSVVRNLLSVDNDLVITLNERPHEDVRGRDVLIAISFMSRLEIAARDHGARGSIKLFEIGTTGELPHTAALEGFPSRRQTWMGNSTRTETGPPASAGPLESWMVGAQTLLKVEHALCNSLLNADGFEDAGIRIAF